MTGHTIKLRQPTYDRLEEIRQKRETYDDTVSRLLHIYTTLELMQHKIARQGIKQLEKETENETKGSH